MQFICFAAVCWQLRTFVPCKVWPKKIKSDLDWQCSVLTCWKIAAATASAPRSLGQFLQRPCKFGANKKIMFWVFVECIGNLALGSSKTASSQITQPCIYLCMYVSIYLYLDLFIYLFIYVYVCTHTHIYTDSIFLRDFRISGASRVWRSEIWFLYLSYLNAEGSPKGWHFWS